MFERTILAFGSESGNAERLAQKTSAQLQQQSIHVNCEALDNLNLAELATEDLLLVITSTFGDGAPPGNARAFAEQLSATQTVSPFQYAVFGLGDVGYPKFCQFAKTVDASLAEKGARRLVNRVDADLNYQQFFSYWEHCIADILTGRRIDGLNLDLKVTAYSKHCPYSATVNSVEKVRNSSDDVYNVNLSIRNSGMNYRAGDLFYILPNDDPKLYSELSHWFGQDVSPLAGKELRTMSKSLLRSLATASGNKVLKEKLKIKNKAALAEYLYGRDLLDVLKDCDKPGFISVDSLANLLPSRSARAYLVASCGATEGGTGESINLCIRDIAYEAFSRSHSGAASHSLCKAQSGDQVKIFMRSNPDFWIDIKSAAPVLMIGEGTGIAPYIGFLQALENASEQRQTMLIFGETSQDRDFLYQSQLAKWLEKGVLNTLKTGFSTDSEQHYIQHALLDAASDVYQMLNKHAHIYICGSKVNLDKPVDQALTTIIQKHEMCSESEANERLQHIYNDARIYKILY